MARTSKNSRKNRKKTAKRNYSFHNRFYVAPQKHSQKGIIAFGISLGMIFFYFLLVVVSALTGGNLSAFYGSLGLLALIGSMAAFVLAMQSRGERQSFKLFPNLATTFSIISCVIWAVTYGIGMGI